MTSLHSGAAMRKAMLLLMLSLLACAGCSSQACRPCGPGFLHNIFVPQGFAGVDFRDACHQHDHCYGTDCPRKDCDEQFREDLLCACECSPHPALCRLRAWQWYWQVRLGGAPGYWQAQREGGCDCGCCECCAALGEAGRPLADGDVPTPTIE